MFSLKEAAEEAMRSLATRRPLFHSEADFQLELAWELRSLFPHARVRMEVPPASLGLDGVSRGAVDIVLQVDGGIFLIELKLGKAAVNVVVDDERFVYPSPAPDIARYGFLRDLVRLEQWSASTQSAAILLANDSRLWTERRGAWSDSAFDLNEGRCVAGRLDWSGNTSATTRRQKPSLQLDCAYELQWSDYVQEPLESKFLTAIVGGAQTA